MGSCCSAPLDDIIVEEDDVYWFGDGQAGSLLHNTNGGSGDMDDDDDDSECPSDPKVFWARVNERMKQFGVSGDRRRCSLFIGPQSEERQRDVELFETLLAASQVHLKQGRWESALPLLVRMGSVWERQAVQGSAPFVDEVCLLDRLNDALREEDALSVSGTLRVVEESRAFMAFEHGTRRLSVMGQPVDRKRDQPPPSSRRRRLSLSRPPVPDVPP